MSSNIEKQVEESGGLNQALQKQEIKKRNKKLSAEEKKEIDNNINQIQEEYKPEKIIKRRASKKLNSNGNTEIPLVENKNASDNDVVVKSDNIKNENIPLQDRPIIQEVEDKIKPVGSKEEVFYGKALRTAGKLTQQDLIRNKSGKIVSKKKSENATRLGTASRLKPFSKSAGGVTIEQLEN
jgi:hypothetical protein